MISLKDKITIVFRSFFIQSVFNYQRFQNIGFLFMIIPFLKKINKDMESLRVAVKRHFEIFNTQPYMSCFVAGNVLKMESLKKEEKEITNIKQALVCAYASIGDRIFWSRLRVIVAEFTFLIFIVLYFCYCKNNMSESIMVSIIVPTIFYSVYSVYIRYLGLNYSWECGGTKNCGLDAFNWNKIIRVLSKTSLFLTMAIYVIVLFLYGFFYINYGSKKENVVYILLPFISILVQRYFRKDKKNIFYPLSAIFFISLGLAVLI